MWKIYELKLPFIYFYFFGQTSFVPLKRVQLDKLLVVAFIPKLVYLLVIASTIYLIITQNHKWPNAFDFNTILVIAIFIFNCTSGCLVLFTSLTSPFALRTICNIFADVIEYTERRFLLSISLHQLQRNFQKKILILLVLEIISGCLRSIHLNSSLFKPITNISVVILLIYKVIMILHIQFYIDLIGFILYSVNEKLKSVTKIRRHRYSVACTFQRVKWIHYNLWKISKMINNSFGWILVSIMIETCALACLRVYWIFVYIETEQKEHIIYLSSKYINYNSFF